MKILAIRNQSLFSRWRGVATTSIASPAVVSQATSHYPKSDNDKSNKDTSQNFPSQNPDKKASETEIEDKSGGLLVGGETNKKANETDISSNDNANKATQEQKNDLQENENAHPVNPVQLDQNSQQQLPQADSNLEQQTTKIET